MTIWGHFGVLLAILESFLAIFGSFSGHLWYFCFQFFTILSQLIQCQYSLPHVDYLPKQFRLFCRYFGLFWYVLVHFYPFGNDLIIFSQFGLCIKTLFKWYLCIWVIFGWYLCVIWLVFVYGGYGFARFGYNVVHLFPRSVCIYICF